MGWKEACSDLARMVDHAWLRHRMPEKVGMPWDTAMGDMVGDAFYVWFVLGGGRTEGQFGVRKTKMMRRR